MFYTLICLQAWYNFFIKLVCATVVRHWSVIVSTFRSERTTQNESTARSAPSSIKWAVKCNWLGRKDLKWNYSKWHTGRKIQIFHILLFSLPRTRVMDRPCSKRVFPRQLWNFHVEWLSRHKQNSKKRYAGTSSHTSCLSTGRQQYLSSNSTIRLCQGNKAMACQRHKRTYTITHKAQPSESNTRFSSRTLTVISIQKCVWKGKNTINSGQDIETVTIKRNEFYDRQI